VADGGLEPALPIVVELPGDRRLTIRAMAEGDADGIMALYDALSADDRYRRFFSSYHAPLTFVRTWIRRTAKAGFGLVAVADEGKPSARLVAEAGYTVLPNGDGELAITIAHDWRGWLGPYLLDLLVVAAAARGVPNLEADVLMENRPMQSVLHHRGDVTIDDNDDFTVIRLAIGAASGPTPTWPSSPGRHVLVEIPGGRWPHGGAAHKAGFEVLSCGVREAGCPALHGRPCPLAAGADVIVVALPPSDARSRALLSAHARLHPDIPLVVQGGPKGGQGAADHAGGPEFRCALHAGSTATEAVAALREVLGDAQSPPAEQRATRTEP